MNVLSDPRTRLARFVEELADAARLTAPLSETAADGLLAGAETFAALARDPQALQDTIAEAPRTLGSGTGSLRRTRPFLESLADVSGDLRTPPGEIRRSAPPIEGALRSGVRRLADSPALNVRL